MHRGIDLRTTSKRACISARARALKRKRHTDRVSTRSVRASKCCSALASVHRERNLRVNLFADHLSSSLDDEDQDDNDDFVLLTQSTLLVDHIAKCVVFV